MFTYAISPVIPYGLIFLYQGLSKFTEVNISHFFFGGSLKES